MAKKVFEFSTINKLGFKNRVGVAPMVIGKSNNKDGVASEFHLKHYVHLASGEVGFITQGATAVSEEGYLSDDCLGIFDEKQRDALKKIVENVHQYDCKIGIQLNHAGGKGKSTNTTIVAPTKLDEHHVALTKEKIKNIIDSFEKSARYAQEAGYDYIEIHGAHGYLINQFLSPLKNFREDEYGKNRSLFLKEVYEACRRGFSGVIGVRISAEEYEEKGNHIDYYVDLAKEMEKWGMDFISVSTGGVVPFPIEEHPLFQVKYAKRIKECVKLPVMCAGVITKEDEIDSIILNGDCDYVLMGRELLRNPLFMLNWLTRLNES